MICLSNAGVSGVDSAGASSIISLPKKETRRATVEADPGVWIASLSFFSGVGGISRAISQRPDARATASRSRSASPRNALHLSLVSAGVSAASRSSDALISAVSYLS